jgi:hypothetical protein
MSYIYGDMYCRASTRRDVLYCAGVGAALLMLLLAGGCGGDAIPEPYKDFQVIAESESAGTVLYLHEVQRVGENLHLVFRYRDTGTEYRKNSVSCPRVPGDIDASFDPPELKDGWVELRCRMDYPARAEKLGFVVRMCAERSRENADIVLSVDVPAAGQVARPDLSRSMNGVTFSVEAVANLEGKLETGSDRKSAKAVIPYGSKDIVVKEGNESILAVIYKAGFAGNIPDLPREYTEWDQVLVSTGKGVKLGGWPYTSDTGKARYFALVTVGSDPLPQEINACFFSAAKLSSFRREFVFSDLANPRD